MRVLRVAMTVFLFAASAVGMAACRDKHRYDGTCSEDSHCLDFQKCHTGVCVRRESLNQGKTVTAKAPVAGKPVRRKPTSDPIKRTAPQDLRPLPKVRHAPEPTRVAPAPILRGKHRPMQQDHSRTFRVDA